MQKLKKKSLNQIKKLNGNLKNKKRRKLKKDKK